jgi:hypothetical protein
LYNEELHILYSFPNIIRKITSMTMRWAGHTVRMGEERKVFWWESQKERDHGVDMGSEWILGRLAEGVEWIQLAQDRD